MPALEAYYESDAQTFADRVIDNFLSGINPIEMLPGASELWDVMANASQGWSAGSNNMILDAIIDLSKSIATADKAVQDVGKENSGIEVLVGGHDRQGHDQRSFSANWFAGRRLLRTQKL